MNNALFFYLIMLEINPRFKLQIGIHKFSKSKSWQISPQGMKRLMRKCKAFAQFQQSPIRPIHWNVWQNSIVKNGKQLKSTVDQIE